MSCASGRFAVQVEMWLSSLSVKIARGKLDWNRSLTVNPKVPSGPGSKHVTMALVQGFLPHLSLSTVRLLLPVLWKEVWEHSMFVDRSGSSPLEQRA